MNVVGCACSVCGQSIVLAREGKSCVECAITVHQACQPETTCKHCGTTYESANLADAATTESPVLPRNLRPVSNRGLVVLILAAFLLVIGVVVLLLRWLEATAPV